VRNFTMDGDGSDYCGAIDFEGGRLVITNDVASGQSTYPFGNEYKGNWKNVSLRVHEGGVHLALGGLSQSSFLHVPFSSAAGHDGGFHFHGPSLCYLKADNTFNGGVHLDGAGTLIPGSDPAMGAVPATPTPSIFFNSSSAILHFCGGWMVNKNRDFIINTNVTAQIGVGDRSARIAGVITGHGEDGHLCTLKKVGTWGGCLEIGSEDRRTNTIGRLIVEGHLRHVAGTTLITSNAVDKADDNAPFYVAGNSSSYQPAKGVFEVAGGTVKATKSCWMVVKNYGQVIVTNGLFDVSATADYLNAIGSPARTVVGGNGTMTCNRLRVSQTDKRDVNGKPLAEVSVTTGGVLKVRSFFVAGGSGTTCCTLNLDGGQIVARANEDYFLGNETITPWESNILVQVGAGGAIIDTEGYNITVKAPLRSGAAADGGLVKRGTGTLTIANTNGYNGATCVEGGRLAFSHPDGLPAGALGFSPGVVTNTATAPHLTANSWSGNTVRLTDASNLPDSFSGKKLLATFTVPLTATPSLELVNAGGNTVKKGSWNVTRSSDGKSLLLSYQQGTMVTVR
jgi:autotransporter-associated beta strand protein